ncbi:MAG: DUF1214 domain-containing protein [Devosia nanyangense]|uniref:DUF1214 domain-containing protein n=1 Tax=Devosia nanyangense TaxID=1228055 RepID=A0A933NYE9_9HYPH|nr:DUF1214 domain-containing protein [Devosia nanyangense]
MRFLLNLLLMLAVALALGFGLSWYALSDGRLFGAYQSGPWVAWPRAGSPAPDPYSRAFLTRNGALQLGQAEGLQFVAGADSDGRKLDRACRYRIDGTTPVSTFWTLVPTTPDGAGIARPDGPPGFHSARLSRADDGSMQLYVSRTLSPLNWLEITGDGPFQLVLTLYDTTALSGTATGQFSLPAIIRESC